MRSRFTRLAVPMFTATAFVAVAHAQSSYPCANDAPNPYKLVANWETTPRPWSHPLAAAIDSKDNLWVFDRCEEGGCTGSKNAPIFQLGSDGKTIKNFGAGLFVFPHAIAADKDGNVWAADGDAKDGKGMQVTKLSPDGKVLMTLGKAGKARAAPRWTHSINQPVSPSRAMATSLLPKGTGRNSAIPA
jgi:hypothetical protein